MEKVNTKIIKIKTYENNIKSLKKYLYKHGKSIIDMDISKLYYVQF